MNLEKFYEELEILKKEVIRYDGLACDAFFEYEDCLEEAELAGSKKAVRRLERRARMAKREDENYTSRAAYTRAFIDGYLKALEVLESY